MTAEDRKQLLSSFRLIESPGHLLRRNHQRSFEVFARHVGDDVTRQQIALLLALFRHPGASQTTLVDRTGLDKSTLKEMVTRMITRGWVERARDDQDARAWTMSLTREGEQLLLDRIGKVVAAQEEILAPLDPDLRPVFMHCLRVLIGAEPD